MSDAQKTDDKKEAPQNERLEAVTEQLYVRNAELATRNKTLSLLHKIDEIAMAAFNLREMATRITNVLTQDLSFELVALGVCDEGVLEWVSLSCLHDNHDLCLESHKDKQIELQSDSINLVSQTLMSRQRASSGDLVSIFCPAFSEADIKTYQQANDIKSALVYPMFSGEVKVGVLVFGLRRKEGDLTRFEKETMENLLNLVVIALQKAQTYESLKETTEKLLVANKKLKELDEQKTEFLSIASHQLRTPMAVIKGYAQTLNSGMLGDLEPEQKEALKKIQTSTEGLVKLVDQLLNISRIESGRMKFEWENVPVNESVKEVVEFFQPQAKEKELGLEFEPTQEEVYIRADKEKLRQTLTNLVDNAVKYTQEGGVTVVVKKDDGQVLIQVEDTGRGLTDKDKRHLFEKFSQGSASKEAKSTTGMGMFVCKKLTEAMGGTIRAKSEGKGKGSTFVVEFPLLTENAEG